MQRSLPVLLGAAMALTAATLNSPPAEAVARGLSPALLNSAEPAVDIQNVHDRRWRRGVRRNYYQYGYPYAYRPNYYPYAYRPYRHQYGYPYYYRSRPGITLQFSF